MRGNNSGGQDADKAAARKWLPKVNKANKECHLTSQQDCSSAAPCPCDPMLHCLSGSEFQKL
eukprot:2221680-Amphidinium_carterae.1